MLVLVLIMLFTYLGGNNNQPLLVPSPSFLPLASLVPSPFMSPTPSSVPLPSATPTPLPEEFLLDVPFTSQAPEGKWDSVHEELCEEASLLMAQWYVLGKVGRAEAGYKNRIPPTEAEAAMQDMVAWQKDRFGLFESTTAEQTKQMAEDKLHLTVRLLPNATAEVIKRELVSGHIVVVPAAGQVLHNPYFTPPGPPYHMLVVRGYNKEGFITNEPGTRHGEGYVYAESILLNAIHDWTGNHDTVTQGKNVVLSIGK